jgi:hypothetical protein
MIWDMWQIALSSVYNMSVAVTILLPFGTNVKALEQIKQISKI